MFAWLHDQKSIVSTGGCGKIFAGMHSLFSEVLVTVLIDPHIHGCLNGNRLPFAFIPPRSRLAWFFRAIEIVEQQ